MEQVVTRNFCKNYSSKKIAKKTLDTLVSKLEELKKDGDKHQCSILFVVSKGKMQKLKKQSGESFVVDLFYGAPSAIIIYGPKNSDAAIKEGEELLNKVFDCLDSVGLKYAKIEKINKILPATSAKESFGIYSKDIIAACPVGYINKPKSFGGLSKSSSTTNDFLTVI